MTLSTNTQSPQKPPTTSFPSLMSRPFTVMYFFFSSRRRHTRWTGDWSSDVCSSDLSGGKSSDATTQDWTARFLDLRIGVPLVVLGGVLFCAIALAVAYEGYSGRFMKYFSYGKLSQATERALRWLGGFGLLSLAVVFVEIGVFLVVAALQHDPGKAKGLGGALVALAAEPFGPLLLGVVAFGLLAYGVYSFGQARYRRIGPA